MSSPPSGPPDPFLHSASGAASPAHSDADGAAPSASDKPVPALPPSGPASPRDDTAEDAAVQWGGSAYEVPPSLRPEAAAVRSDDEGFEQIASEPPAWSSGTADDDAEAPPALAGSSASLPPDQRRKSARVSAPAPDVCFFR
jgi:hypothetical protein